MKNWLLEKSTRVVLLISLGVAVLYRDSFTSPFFQDDKLLLKLSREGNPFTPILHFPYRPVSINFYYGVSQRLFGLNPFGFHLVEYAAFVGSLFCIYYLALFFTKNGAKSLVTVIFYAFNVSLFANFYWIATSYFSLGALFFFASVLLFLKNKTTQGFVLFLLALGSNEMAFVIPGLLSGVSFLGKFHWKKLIPLWLIGVIGLIGRVVFVGFPQASDYQLKTNLQALSTFRWYSLRALNLPEGVDRAQDPIIWVGFAMVVLILTISIIQYLSRDKKDIKVIIFGVIWYVLGALPFYFIPEHMSSYYLTLALFGPALIVGEVVTNVRYLQILIVAYAVLSIRSLDFLRGSHWIILKNTGPVGKFFNF